MFIASIVTSIRSLEIFVLERDWATGSLSATDGVSRYGNPRHCFQRPSLKATVVPCNSLVLTSSQPRRYCCAQSSPCHVKEVEGRRFFQMKQSWRRCSYPEAIYFRIMKESMYQSSDFKNSACQNYSDRNAQRRNAASCSNARFHHSAASSAWAIQPCSQKCVSVLFLSASVQVVSLRLLHGPRCQTLFCSLNSPCPL
jgi:hypothetical protein